MLRIGNRVSRSRDSGSKAGVLVEKLDGVVGSNRCRANTSACAIGNISVSNRQQIATALHSDGRDAAGSGAAILHIDRSHHGARPVRSAEVSPSGGSNYAEERWLAGLGIELRGKAPRRSQANAVPGGINVVAVIGEVYDSNVLPHVGGHHNMHIIWICTLHIEQRDGSLRSSMRHPIDSIGGCKFH